MKRIGIGSCALALAAVLALAPAAPARGGGAGGLDRSYGANGVAAIAPPPGGHLSSWGIDELASARGGAVYALGRGFADGCWSCGRTHLLLRIGAGGDFDPRFGGETGVVLPKPSLGYSLAVDRRGRPLLADVEAGAVSVRRYAANGRLDPGFGGDGIVSVPCRCQGAVARVVAAPRGRVLVEVDRASSGREYSPGPGAEVALTRLLANGDRDRRFGAGGSLGFTLPKRTRPQLLAVARRGSILLGGSSQRVDTVVYVVRVSARGRLDTRFNRTASSSMRRLSRFGEFPALTSLLPRGDGTIELLGSQFERGFDLRLRANGRLARGFAKRGLRVLPLPVESATLGSGGAVFAATEAPRVLAFRILGSGRLDPRFGGSRGLPVPLHGEGIVVAAQRGRRALVMDRGDRFCRSGPCEATPGIARYVEPAPRRRHRR